MEECLIDEAVDWNIFLQDSELDLYTSMPFQSQVPVCTKPRVPPPVPPRQLHRVTSVPACPADALVLDRVKHCGVTSVAKTAEQMANVVKPPPRPPLPPPRRRVTSDQPNDPHKRLSCNINLYNVQPNRLRRANTTEDNAIWNLKLIATPEGSNERLASFCRCTSRLMHRYPYTDRLANPGLVWGRVSPLHPALYHTTALDISIFVEWLPNPVPFTTSVDKTVEALIQEFLYELNISPGNMGQHLLKFCDSEEFLRNDEILGTHESIKTCQRLHIHVSLRLLHQDAIWSSLARDAEDDNQPFYLGYLLSSTYVFNTSRVVLENRLSSYSKGVLNLIRNKSGSSVNCLAEEVYTICCLLCGVSSRGVEDAIADLRRTTPQKTFLECETALLRLHQALGDLLHVFFSNFDSDFRSEELRPCPSVANVALNEEILQLEVAALYRLQPSWTSYDHFCISCTLTHGSAYICEPGLSENISTALVLGNRLQCSRMMAFPIQINMLPYESMLTFRLLGSKQGKSPELLCWSVLPLFTNRTLVNGMVLLSMSVLDELIGLQTPAVSDDHRQASGVILQVVFPDEIQWQYERPKALKSSIFAKPPFEELNRKIIDVSQKHSVSLLTANEKAFLWSKRHSCNEDNTYLHLLLGSAPQWTPDALQENYTILEHWTLRRPEEALFLLSDCFQDQHVREVAVQHLEQLPDQELEEYLPQLVQALKLEWQLDGPLVQLLLARSLQNIRIAHWLYWLLEDVLEVDRHTRSWLRKVQVALRHCCGRRLRQELDAERRLMKLLARVAEKVRVADRAKRKDVLSAEKKKIGDLFEGGTRCRLPLEPAVLVQGVNLETCMFYNSNAAPLGITFTNADSLGRDITVICKTGDNLRQDMLVLQMVRVMERVWLHSGLDMRMVTYRCLSTGKEQGLIEVVPEAVTLAQIQQEWGLGGTLRDDTLEKWFHMWNRSEEEFEEAVLNFLYSCAGWCVATFILGICDRHNDNIMLRHSGHMFHIDFGKIMGNAQKFASFKRDRSPFIFTSEMLHFITGGGQRPERFHRFVELCCKAYNSIRRRAALILSLLQLMLSAGMPEMKDCQDLQYVHNNLRTQDSDLEATSYFTRMIKESLHSLPVKMNFLFHSIGQLPVGRKPSIQGSTSSPSTNIQEVVIEKYSISGKTVTYELKVKIEDGFLSCGKTFSQFEAIHKELRKLFIESALPQFPSWYKMSFTPSRRMSLLNKYLKELFNGPCKGNEYVCSLFLDGPRKDMAVKSSKKDSSTLGCPQVQLFISHKDETLKILVKHLKNIKMPNGTSPDSYVVTWLRPDPHNCSKKRTEVVRNSNNPTFNELIEYNNIQSLQGKVLELQVKSKRTFLAATNIWLADRKMEMEEWFPLGNCSI